MNIHGNWRKSSFSAPENNCVELALTATEARIRDSKNTDGPTIRVGDMQGFIGAVKGDRLDR